MARRKGTELRTDFTGDDSDFRRTVERNIGGAKKFGGEWDAAGKKANRSVTALSGGMKKLVATAVKAAGGLALVARATKGIRDDFTAAEEIDQMLKLSEALGENFERFQAQAGAARKSGLALQEYYDTLQRVTRLTEQAIMDPNSGPAKSFLGLGIDPEELSKLGPADKFVALAEAYKRHADKDKAFALMYGITEDQTKKLRAQFAGGAEGTLAAEAETVGVVTEAKALEARKLNNALEDQKNIERANRLRSLGAIKFGKGLRSGINKAKSGLEDAGGAVFRFFGGKGDNELEGVKKEAADLSKVLIEPQEMLAEATDKATDKLVTQRAEMHKTAKEFANDIPALMGLRTSHGIGGGSGGSKPSFPGLDALRDLQNGGGMASFPGLDALKDLQGGDGQAKVVKSVQGLTKLTMTHLERIDLAMEQFFGKVEEQL